MPDYRAIAAADARKAGVPVAVFLRQIQQESGFNPAARSGAGAQGIAQFMPATARQYGVDTADPISSLAGAARMDADLIRRYGSVARALSAYNSGRPDAYKDPGFAKGQTYNYVRSILGGTGSGGAGTAVFPAPAAAGQPPAPQQADPRAGLLHALAQTKGGDLTGFYRQLGAARQTQLQQPAPVSQFAPAPSQTPGGYRGGTYNGPAGQVGGATQGEQPSFLAALAALAGYRHQPIQINSGYRSTADQTRLWNNRASNPNPVARPGSSLHERGLAADGTIGGIPIGTLPPALLARFGLQPVAGDPVHVQLLRR